MQHPVAIQSMSLYLYYRILLYHSISKNRSCKVQWLAFVHLASCLASSPLAPPTASQNRKHRRGVDEGRGPGVASQESQGVEEGRELKTVKLFFLGGHDIFTHNYIALYSQSRRNHGKNKFELLFQGSLADIVIMLASVMRISILILAHGLQAVAVSCNGSTTCKGL